MANVRQLKDHGAPIFPITHVSLVKGMEGRALMDATYAWDGTGTPDVSKIPAGVVVTYNGTDYTGTLVASASTTGRFYLVPSTTVQGEWDRYMTDGTGSSYAWKAAGNTSIPSPDVVDNETTDDSTKSHSAAGGKRLKDQLGELEAKVFDKVFNYPFVPGNYLDANGADVAFWNGSSTDFIEASEGDDFYFTGQTTGAFRNVCGYNASKVFVSVLYQGAGNNTKITITNPTIAYVRACANNNDSGKSFTKTNPNSMGALSEKVNNLGQEIETEVVDYMTAGIVDGKYVGHNGNVYSNDSFAYKEFSVLNGAVIDLTSVAHGNIAIIAKKIGESKYEELVPGTDFTTVTINFTATEDMTIAVSFYKDAARSITITTELIHSNRENIEKLLLDRQTDKNDAEIQSMDFGFLFNKIAVIGDSMSVATMDGYTGPLGASWLSFLAKRWASVGKEWYAMGGTSAYQWLNDTNYGLGKLLADETIYNCYFIAYGHNDSATVGEATDEAAPVTITDGVPSCPDGYSFCAYYKAIINQIRTKAPHAMIFCLSQYDYSVAPGGWHSQYGEAVVDVAELIYNGGDKLVHHLDTGGVPVSGMDIGGHYSTIGYAYIAKRINDEANKVIYQYRADTEIKTFGVYNL